MLTVRSAEIDDAPGIAKVHVETWRTAYTGIIPQDYIDSMTVENRTLVWARLLQRSGGAFTTLVSEDHDQRIVGFVSGGPLRHKDPRYQAEVSSLYVQRSHQRNKHGQRLFLAAANRLAGFGLRGLFVWVLTDNPARRFYEELGGEQIAETTRLFAGKPLTEVGYGWKDTPRYG
ncbi:MAG: GNAT family N-acetyltransferase [Rhodospirillaceae bacterium]|nr:GNAT family N-acetyltransferase [Rhodospirillaceae bacterium]